MMPMIIIVIVVNDDDVYHIFVYLTDDFLWFLVSSIKHNIWLGMILDGDTLLIAI